MVPGELSENLLEAAQQELASSRALRAESEKDKTFRSLGTLAIGEADLQPYETVLIQALRLRLEGKRLNELRLTATSDYNNWYARQAEHHRRHDSGWMESFLWMIDLDTGAYYDEEGEQLAEPTLAEVIPFPEQGEQSAPAESYPRAA